MYAYNSELQDYKNVYGPDSKLYGPYHWKSNNRWVVDVASDGRKKTMLAARLILEIKLNRKLIDDETVDHIDNDKTNDDPSNLQVLSGRDNARKGSLNSNNLDDWLYNPIHAERRSYNASGERNSAALFTNEDIERFRSIPKYHGMIKQLAMEHGCSYKTMQNILNGTSYRK